MRIQRSSICLLVLLLFVVLVCGLEGCSQTGAALRANSSGNSNIKTVASVGDKPFPIVAGESGSSLRAEPEEPEPPHSSGTQVSGRVFDDRGKLVPNAKVRLAVGGSAGGKVISATTDRSGAFTLHGLRRGSSYTLIAEYDGDGEGVMTGRAQVKAPQTDVKIALQPGDEPAEGHASIRPARPRVEPISNVDPMEDEPAKEDGDAGRLNFEDIGPPAAEATSVRPQADLQLSHSQAAGDISRARTSGRSSWTLRPASSASAAASKSAQAQAGEQEDAGAAKPAGSEPVDSRAEALEDDGENPLPPAREPAQPRVSRAESRADDAPVRVARSGSSRSRARRRTDQPTTSVDSSDPAGVEPAPMPEGVRPGEQVITPGAYGPIKIGDPGEQSSSSAPAPARRTPGDSAASTRETSRASEPDSQQLAPDPAVAASNDNRPTWRDLGGPHVEVPLDESVAKASHVVAAGEHPVVTLTSAEKPEPGPVLSRLFAGSRPKRDDAIKQSVCQVDPTERRVVDFQLSNVDGKWVSLRDIEADVILLDFWGSWCEPCRRSTAHLTELQTKLAGKRFQVVGIACEKGASSRERQVETARAARELAINYPVLVTTKGGSCPVQQALQVQFYPTMLLLDRNGHILAREQGATDTTLLRMDRAVAAALRGDKTNALR